MNATIRNFSITLVLTILCGWALAACGTPAAPTAVVPATAAQVQPTSAPTAIASTVPTTPPTSAPTAVPPTAVSGAVTVTDSAGRSVTLEHVPGRIVSLAPSTTEIVCALGECDSLIGIDQFSDFPAQVKNLPKISDGFNPNYEQIVASKPDLVLVAGITSPDVIKKLDELKLTTLVVGTVNSSFASIEKDIALVGKVIGADKQAAEVAGGMETKISALRTRLAGAKTKPRVFWELDATDPAKPFTPGPGTFVDELIKLAQGENIAAQASSPYVQLSAERVIQANPQVIILSDAAYGVAPETVGKRPGWDVIDAVKNGKVFPIDDNLVSRPGPRVVEGLEAAAKLIHPELFAEGSSKAFDNPFAYCSAVGTVDAPDASYTGERVPKAIADGLRKALGGATTPEDVWVKGTFWRCMGGKVYACNVGANIPCESKADTNKTATQGETDFCKQNPSADIIPAFVTGHETVYEWACKNGVPEIVKQVIDVDAQGYPADFWHVIPQ